MNDKQDTNTEAIETLVPQPMRPAVSIITSMATLFQKWAEMCERVTTDELTPEMRWFFKGAAYAHEMDAKRARTLAIPTDAKTPPTGNLGLGQAYDIMINMLSAMGIASEQE